MSNPYFSILMPCYNVQKYIAIAINSCLNQTFDDFELICLDDKSTDNTLNIIESFNNNHLRIIKHEQNLGTLKTRNDLVREAKGKYIIWCDSDDYMNKSFLQIAYKILNKKHYDMIQFNTCWKLNNNQREMRKVDYQKIDEKGCLDIYISRNDLDQGTLWGKVISTDVMNKSLPPDEFNFCLDDVFYNAKMFYYTKSYLVVNSQPVYFYNAGIGKFNNHQRQMTYDRISKMCLMRINQFVYNANFFNECKLDKSYTEKYINKLYLSDLFSDIFKIKNNEQIKKSMALFLQYFSIGLSINFNNIKDNKDE